MNRRSRTFIVVGLAVVLAMLASLGVYRAVLRASAAQPTSASHDTVVAAKDIPLGSMLTKDDVRLVAWPNAAAVPETFSNVNAVVGRGVIAPFVANEPIVPGKLAPIEAGAGLPPAIPPGMRAMAVKVNDVIGVAGFTVPGTRVDVVATVKPDKENISRVVLSNVQVLSAGTNQEQTRTNDPIRAGVVTLLVTPADSEKLALAMNEGRISLALRNPLDIAATATNGARMSSLVTTPATPTPVTPAPKPKAVARPPVAVVTAPPPPPPPPPYTVEVFRAAKRSDEVVK